MAKPKQEKKSTSEAPADQAHLDRLDTLEADTNKVCDLISTGSRSFLAHAKKFRSVEPRIVEACFDAMEKEIAKAREDYAASQQGDDVGEVSRVSLRNL